MGGAVCSGFMAGTLAQPQPGGSDSVIVRRAEALKPGEPPGFIGFGNEPPKHGQEPPHISEECTVTNDF